MLDAWTQWMNNNSSPNGVGWQGGSFNPTFNVQQQGTTPFNRTPAPAVPQLGNLQSNLLQSTMPNTNPLTPPALTSMQQAPQQQVYNPSQVQQGITGYLTGQQQLPQLQPLLDELERKQHLERLALEERLTNRGIGNSTIADQGLSDLSRRQNNEFMNLATNAALQLIPMQVEATEAMRRGDIGARQQQVAELLGSLGAQEQLAGSQFGRQLAARQQGVGELMDALRLQEALEQGQFSRDAGAASLLDTLSQSAFNRNLAGYQQQLDEFLRFADLFNQNRQIDYGQRLGAFNAFSEALGRLNPGQVSPGGEPGPDAIESAIDAMLKFLSVPGVVKP